MVLCVLRSNTAQDNLRTPPRVYHAKNDACKRLRRGCWGAEWTVPRGIEVDGMCLERRESSFRCNMTTCVFRTDNTFRNDTCVGCIPEVRWWSYLRVGSFQDILAGTRSRETRAASRPASGPGPQEHLLLAGLPLFDRPECGRCLGHGYTFGTIDASNR